MFGWRCEVVMPMTSGLPRDIVVNVFNVVQGGSDGDTTLLHEGVLDDVLPNFYNSDAGTSGSMASFLSSVIDRGSNKCRIDAYQIVPLGTESGPPITSQSFTLGASGTSGFDLPNQCAGVASLMSTHDDLQSGDLLPLANRRGRLYLGPLRSNALSGSSTGLTLLSEAFITSACDQCAQLASILDTVDDSGDGSSSHFSWVIASKRAAKTDRTAVGLSPIGRGWCDNRVDTQRRRQEDATHRATWTVTGGTTP